ncbi:GyrI-like domain-containing protein [Flavobacteriales bacterium]|nr:GyrI-like domain-containing protein [Flavobacteriales bacterium]
MQIIKEDYQSALVNYKTAFNNVNNVFAKDMHNSILCAIKIDSSDFAINMVEEIIRKGVNKRFIEKKYKALNKHPRWSTLFNRYFKISNRYLLDIDTALYHKAIIMSEKDQEFRVKHGSYSVYGDTINYIDEVGIENLEQGASIIIDKTCKPNNEVNIIEFEPGKCAVRRYELNSFFEFKDVWKDMKTYTDNHELDFSMSGSFEVYQPKRNNKAVVDICIPLKKN